MSKFFSMLLCAGLIISWLIGCTKSSSPIIVLSSDFKSNGKAQAMVDRMPNALTQHFPAIKDLTSNWRIAFHSRGMQASVQLQLELDCNGNEAEKLKIHFLNSMGDSALQVDSISGLKNLFSENPLTKNDVIFVGKDLESPNIFGLILRSNQRSLIYFAIDDK